MLPNPIECPLNEGHCDQINTALDATGMAKQHCAKCAAAGLDMKSYQQTLEQQEAILKGLKTQFFPHRN